MHITELQRDGHTDIRTNPNCIIIKNFETKFTFATAISGISNQPDIQHPA